MKKISLFLVLTLLFTGIVFIVPASAAGATYANDTAAAAAGMILRTGEEGSATYYGKWEDAVKDFPSGGDVVVNIIRDYETSTRQIIGGLNSITINGNNHTITSAAVDGGGNASYCFRFDCAQTINDLTIYNNGETKSGSGPAIQVNAGFTATFNNCVLKSLKPQYASLVVRGNVNLVNTDVILETAQGGQFGAIFQDGQNSLLTMDKDSTITSGSYGIRQKAVNTATIDGTITVSNDTTFGRSRCVSGEAGCTTVFTSNAVLNTMDENGKVLPNGNYCWGSAAATVKVYGANIPIEYQVASGGNGNRMYFNLKGEENVWGLFSVTARLFATSDAEGKTPLAEYTQEPGLVIAFKPTVNNTDLLLDNEADKSGVRFETMIPAAVSRFVTDLADAGSISYGTLIAPASYVEKAGGVFTKDALDAATGINGTRYLDVETNKGIINEQNGDIRLFAAIVKLKASHTATDFAAVGYIRYKVGGVEKILYADYNADRDADACELAYAELTDVKAEKDDVYKYETTEYYVLNEGVYTRIEGTAYSRYTTDQIAVLKSYIPAA